MVANKNYFVFFLPIKEASKGFASASSFLDFALSAAVNLGVLAAFFIRCAVTKAKFLYRSVFFMLIKNTFYATYLLSYFVGYLVSERAARPKNSKDQPCKSNSIAINKPGNHKLDAG